jgi:hypothetical protein
MGGRRKPAKAQSISPACQRQVIIPRELLMAKESKHTLNLLTSHIACLPDGGVRIARHGPELWILLEHSSQERIEFLVPHGGDERRDP